MVQKRNLISVLSTLLFILLLSSATGTAGAKATVTYDVAADGLTFVINRATPGESGINRGDTFVLNGKVFPGGTIPAGGTKAQPSSFGPNSPGSIGDWYCRGLFLVNGTQFASEKVHRATTHYFILNNKDRLFTEGFEGAVTTNRVIVGGINNFAGARGVLTMQRLGTNSTGSYNFRFVFTME